ncbi:MAG: phosphoribosylanthranilate isomerase [Lachnospiraceae bacterium]|nr:phosphoribosylanthranilate isomerase [Lachnospiraceae bacterium]
MVRVKLCGIRKPEEIDVINEIKPEYMGFVFVKSSKRYISPEDAKELKERLSPDVKAVGVFVDEAQENILKLLDEKIIDCVQLHGSEDEEYISSLKKKTDAFIIKAFKEPFDMQKTEKFPADMLLFDSGTGSGMTFNWELLKEVERPFILAGGLNPENVGSAIETLNPYGVDVSSGIETDGKKDIKKIRQFVEHARKA